MKRIYLLCGIPGSGKSTWAKSQLDNKSIWISRDQIRFSMVSESGEYFSKEKEVFRESIKEINLAIMTTYNKYGYVIGIQVEVSYGDGTKEVIENKGEINNDEELMDCVTDLADVKKKYERFKNAIDEVEATGYGIVMPTIEELKLEEPEIMRQGGRYGVKLCASAPSIHMMKANITTEVNPIVGSEKQSEDLVKYLLDEFEEDPIKIWDSNIFGKSLNELVNEGLHTKLSRMPDDARIRLQETLERLINEGCSGLICIIL